MYLLSALPLGCGRRLPRLSVLVWEEVCASFEGLNEAYDTCDSCWGVTWGGPGGTNTIGHSCGFSHFVEKNFRLWFRQRGIQLRASIVPPPKHSVVQLRHTSPSSTFYKQVRLPLIQRRRKIKNKSLSSILLSNRWQEGRVWTSRSWGVSGSCGNQYRWDQYTVSI